MNIDDIYLSIAKNIVSSIESNWELAQINFEYYGSAAEYHGRFYQVGSDEAQNFKVGYSTYKLFKKLHGITTENDSNKWNRAVFNLKPTGEFNIDFSWDQELADEIERLNNE